MSGDFAITAANSVNFTDTSKMSLQDMIFIVTLQTYGAQSEKCAAEVAKVQSNNIKLQNLNKGMAVFNNMIKDNVNIKPAEKTITITNELTGDDETLNITEFLDRYAGGCPVDGTNLTMAGLSKKVSERLKPDSDEISSTSSTDQLKIQRYTNNINNTFTMASTLISKFEKLNETITGNMR